MQNKAAFALLFKRMTCYLNAVKSFDDLLNYRKIISKDRGFGTSWIIYIAGLGSENEIQAEI